MLEQRLPRRIQVYELPANRQLLEDEAMKAVGVGHGDFVTRDASEVYSYSSRITDHASRRKLLLEQLIQLRRIGFAAGALHNLTDKETKQFVLA